MRIYRKVYVVSINLQPFVSNIFKFDTNNFELLRKVVLQEERKTFFTNSFQQTTEDKYFINACVGGRRVVGDPPDISKDDIIHANR